MRRVAGGEDDDFFCNDTATTEIYTPSLHDALPICRGPRRRGSRLLGRRALRARRQGEERGHVAAGVSPAARGSARTDRKSTRLNSSHANISHAVFCLKKKTSRSSPTAAQPPANAAF